jgi:hypothetical protein
LECKATAGDADLYVSTAVDEVCCCWIHF